MCGETVEGGWGGLVLMKREGKGEWYENMGPHTIEIEKYFKG